MHGLSRSKNKQSFEGDLPEAKKTKQSKRSAQQHPSIAQSAPKFHLISQTLSTLLCCYDGSTLYCQIWCCMPGVQDVAHISGVRLGLSVDKIRGVCRNLKPRESEKGSRGKICDEALETKVTRLHGKGHNRRVDTTSIHWSESNPHSIESGKRERKTKREREQVSKRSKASSRGPSRLKAPSSLFP